MGFVVRPLGALLFGHIGDTYGRNNTLRIAIICMAVPTVVIGCLPTYSIGPYTAGLAAPILLTIFRLLQVKGGPGGRWLAGWAVAVGCCSGLLLWAVAGLAVWLAGWAVGWLAR